MRRHLSFAILVLLTLGFLVAGAAAKGTPGGGDVIAILMLQPLQACQSRLGSAPIMADLTGRMMFEQGRPGRGGMIPVEFLGLRLMGGGSPDPGEVGGGQPDPSNSFFDVWVMLDPSRMSTGQLAGAGQGAPVADSFFDIFVDLTINGSTAPLMLRATMPVHLTAMTPGVLETRFQSMQPVVFVLPPAPGTTNGGTPCVELRRMTYVPVNPSAAIIKRELIEIEKKLDRLLKLLEPPPCDASECPTGQ